MKKVNLILLLFCFIIVAENTGCKKDPVQTSNSGSQGGNNSNKPPTAVAGNDTTITLPANTINLDGSRSTDPDNNITSYQWTKIEGPSSFSIVNASGLQTQANNLTEGVYLVELKITDAGGLFDRDTIKITVDQQPPSPPCTTNCGEIVFVSNRDGNDEIYSCNADGSNITRLTNSAAVEGYPAWSPDGTKIAFTSNRSGNDELYIMNADGSNIVQKTFAGNLIARHPSWSPDGSKIVFEYLNSGWESKLWVVSTTGAGSPTILFSLNYFNSSPNWSPDGAKIALMGDNAVVFPEPTDIYTINADGTGPISLTASFTASAFKNYHMPSWSPSGTRLAMLCYPLYNNPNNEAQVVVVNPDGTGYTMIHQGAIGYSKTCWTADGSKIVYTSLSGIRKDISWVAADGSARGTIVTNGWNADWKH